MRRPPSLVRDELSQDTIECLRHLLAEAEQGRVIGVAFAALMKRHHFIAHTCGEIRRNRVLARGMLQELDDELRAQ